MDLQQEEELENLSLVDILRKSISIPRSSPRTFALITLAFIFPLSFAILAHSLFTHPLINHLCSASQSSSASSYASDWSLLFLYQFVYLLFLFTFSLLSTAAVVFTAASLYAAKHVSFSSTISAIPTVFARLFHTFLWVYLVMFVYNAVYSVCIFAIIISTSFPDSAASVFLFSVVTLAFLAAHMYISALWHLASVISVMEPFCGLAAMAKSRGLLRRRTHIAITVVIAYSGIWWLIGDLFRTTVVMAPYEEGSIWVGPVGKVVIGVALVAMLVAVNLVGLLFQSVFYYVCKSFHHQKIDKTALHDHLGGYLGEYVPLKSSIQMEIVV
ncbi:uncharacterized protein [Typha latifolia]|uniref:uncharacterized protein n=1 Tax=Typha latifolia TaxID=4733 RepID=UPI003C2D66C7